MEFSNIAEELILSIAKEDGLELAKLLYSLGNIDEFTLAEKFERDVNYVRSLLYSLYEYKIVSYSRKRDPKKMWWIYYWEINNDRINELLLKNIKKEIIDLEDQKLKLYDNQTFECKECGRVFNFEASAENNFQCPACAKVLQYVDSSFLLKEVEDKIGSMSQMLNKINKELADARIEEENQREIAKEKEKKKKTAKRKADKKKKTEKKTKKKTTKKTTKKPTKKTVKKKTIKKISKKKTTKKK